MTCAAPRLLLHVCCGPCATAVIERLAADYRVTLYWFNPNIQPREEYEARLQAARTLAEAHLVRYPQDKGSRVILARGFLSRNLQGLAEAECRKALANETGDPYELAARKLLAVSLNRSGNPAKAADEMKLYLERRPNDLDAVVRQSIFLATSQGPEAGLALLREARGRFPDDYHLAVCESQLLQQSGDTAAAIATAQRAVELGADGVAVQLRLTVMLLDEKRFQEALVHARLAHDLAPRSHLVTSYLGWSLVVNDRLDEALPYLQAALAAAPAAPRYHYQYAVYLHRRNLDKEAREELRMALDCPREFAERKAAEELLASLGGTEP